MPRVTRCPSLAGRTTLLTALFGILIMGGALGFLLWQQVEKARLLEALVAQRDQQLATLEMQRRDLDEQAQILKHKREELQKQVTSLGTELSEVKTRLTNAELTSAQLQQEKKDGEAKRTLQQAKLDAVTSERDDAQQRLKQLEEEHTTLKRSLSRVRERLAWLDRDYRHVSEQLTQLQDQHRRGLAESVTEPLVTDNGSFSMMAAAPGASSSSALRPTASATSGTVELPPIIVRKEQGGVPLPLRARVLEVSDPHHFIIVDKGSLDGVRMGMVLNILRGSTPVGRVQVVRVRPNLAACDVLRAMTAGPIQVGDVAIDTTR